LNSIFTFVWLSIEMYGKNMVYLSHSFNLIVFSFVTFLCMKINVICICQWWNHFFGITTKTLNLSSNKQNLDLFLAYSTLYIIANKSPYSNIIFIKKFSYQIKQHKNKIYKGNCGSKKLEQTRKNNYL
jgi:hypothetical protein